MTRRRRLFYLVVGLAVLAGLLTFRHELGPPRPFFGLPDSAPVWSSTADVNAEENAARHWRKHGAEFPELRSAEDYETAARKFVNAPPPGTLIKHRSNGDTLFYNPATNTFAVRAPDGAPRTMFRPDAGIRYWERQ